MTTGARASYPTVEAGRKPALMPTEAEIRDYLAEHLDLIEDGLLLQRKEYPLPNPTGASGFIGIFWRAMVRPSRGDRSEAKR